MTAEKKTDAARVSRRSFLRRGAIAGGVAATGGLAAPAVLAQSPLVFSRDTLVYLDPSRDHATAINTTADTVVVDSLGLGGGLDVYSGWALTAEQSPVEDEWPDHDYYLSNWYTGPPQPPLALAPGDSLTLEASGWDPCGICRAQNSGRALDTLLVYVDGSSVPQRLFLDPSLWVDAAQAPDVPALALALTVGPNPSREAATLRFALDAPASVVAEVFDAQGRRVATLHDGPLGAGLHGVPVSTAGWPPGVYTVRLGAGDRQATVPLTVTR